MGAGPGPAAQNRVPLDQYEALRASGDAIAEKCKIWVGVAGDERGKLGALCRRFLYTDTRSNPLIFKSMQT